MKTLPTAQHISSRLHQHYTEYYVGTGAQLEFLLSHTIGRTDDLCVYVDGVRQRAANNGLPKDYSIRGITAGYSGPMNAIRFTVAPIFNADVIVDLNAT